jgi:hypothetical protein
MVVGFTLVLSLRDAESTINDSQQDVAPGARLPCEHDATCDLPAYDDVALMPHDQQTAHEDGREERFAQHTACAEKGQTATPGAADRERR